MEATKCLILNSDIERSFKKFSLLFHPMKNHISMASKCAKFFDTRMRQKPYGKIATKMTKNRFWRKRRKSAKGKKKCKGRKSAKMICDSFHSLTHQEVPEYLQKYASIHHAQKLCQSVLQIVQDTITWFMYNSI